MSVCLSICMSPKFCEQCVSKCAEIDETLYSVAALYNLVHIAQKVSMLFEIFGLFNTVVQDKIACNYN